jgi:hypothetical protein
MMFRITNMMAKASPVTYFLENVEGNNLSSTYLFIQAQRICHRSGDTESLHSNTHCEADPVGFVCNAKTKNENSCR